MHISVCIEKKKKNIRRRRGRRKKKELYKITIKSTNKMDINESILASWEDIMNKTKATLDEANQSILITDLSRVSKEEEDFHKLMFGDDIAAVRHLRIHCTACDTHIGSAPSQSWNMFAHPILLTLLCSKCRKFYGDGNFEQGEDATDMFCRWCANGGNLYCCSYCSNTFCNKCIKRNFDPLIRKKIEDEERWKCFVCDPSDLYTARAVCRALLQHAQTVTRILRNDRNISKREFKEKMELDESKCCAKKRNRAKRIRLNTRGSEDEDETYHPSLEDIGLATRPKGMKKSPRSSWVINGEEEANPPPLRNTRSFGKPSLEQTSIKVEEDEDFLPPMIPCVQSMVEGESSETIIETLNSLPNIPGRVGREMSPAPGTLHINPIPTANLLKVAPPPLTLLQNNSPKGGKRKRTFQHILPAPTPGFVMVKNQTPKNIPSQNIHGIEYSSLPLRPPNRQPNAPMVAIPGSNAKNSSPSSMPIRIPSNLSNAAQFKPNSQLRVIPQKSKPASSTSSANNEVRVIEIGSDSDEPEIRELEGDKNSANKSRDVLKVMLNKSRQENLRSPDPFSKRKADDGSNEVEEEIDSRTEEVRMLFKFIGTRLRKVPLLHFPNHNNLRSTRVKTRRFHLAIAKAISSLTDINDKVINKYSNWRKSMLDVSEQTKSNDVDTTNENTSDNILPLEMICTNSESESDNNDECDSDDMLLFGKTINVKSFQERDTVDVAVGDEIPTADKSVQAYDLVERDYEKCIGHSVLTKVEYDPEDGSEILKPVIVPTEHKGKYEEQFIFYLQHREENEVVTDDDRGLPNPNETPLKDLIEANSPFVLEMLENIDSPLTNGTNNELGRDEVSKEVDSVKENEKIESGTNAVEELAKMVTELSEDLKTSNNSDNLLDKKHSEQGKKDRRKQILDPMESEEVDIAVQTLIEEDERSRSSTNDDDILSRNNLKIDTTDGDKMTNNCSGYSEDECTIID